MTDQEKKIAEIREFYRYHPEDNINKLNVNFLLSELDRIKNIADDLNNDVFGLRMMLEKEREENRKLREELDKLIEGLRPLMRDLSKMAVNPSNARAFPSYRKMRDILKEIGVTI